MKSSVVKDEIATWRESKLVFAALARLKEGLFLPQI